MGRDDQMRKAKEGKDDSVRGLVGWSASGHLRYSPVPYPQKHRRHFQVMVEMSSDSESGASKHFPDFTFS